MLPVELMGPVTAARLPTGPGWAFEPKYDGYRAAVINTGQAQIVSRRGTDLTAVFPELADAIGDQVPDNSMLDCELVVLREGRLSFDALQQRMARGPRQAAQLARAEPATLVAFDLLLDQGIDVRPLPWEKRRQLLEATGSTWRPPLQLTPYTTDHDTAAEWMTAMVSMGIEGIVSKRRSSRYGAPGAWSKTKHYETLHGVVGATIGPLTHPEALIVGRYTDAGDLVVLGRTTALTPAQATQVGRLLSPPTGPHPWPTVMAAGHFGGDPVTITHADPRVLVEVKADPAEQGGRRRHPLRFLRTRHD